MCIYILQESYEFKYYKSYKFKLSNVPIDFTNTYVFSMYFNKHGKFPTNEELQHLSWQEKEEILNYDHVKQAHMFHYMIQGLMNQLSLKSCPLGKLVDFFYRIESQRRGKLHLHMASWHENSVRFSSKDLNEVYDGKNPAKEKELYNYIDKNYFTHFLLTICIYL